MRRNILIISPSFFNKGGVASVARNYMRHCRSSEIKCFVVASQSHGFSLRKIIFFLSAIFLTLYHLLFHHIHIVHVHGGNIISLKRKLLFLKLSALFRVKTIYHHHGGNLILEFRKLSAGWKSIIRYVLSEVDLIICLSNSMKKQLTEAIPGVTCRVVPNGVVLPDLRRSTPKKRDDPLTLSFMGFIHREKGLFDILNVVKRLIDDGYFLKLSICGSGEVEQLKEATKMLNLEAHVKYHGYLTGDQKDKFFRNTDIFALPSYSEAMPVVILEAMSYALPVVSTAVGAIPELVKNNVNGYLSEPGDLNSLYTNIVKLAYDPFERRKMGEEGRRFVEKKYNHALLCSEVLSVYKSI